MAAETTDGRGGTCAPAEVKEMRQKGTKNKRGATRGPASELAAGWAEQSLRNNRLASTHPRFFLVFFFFNLFTCSSCSCLRSPFGSSGQRGLHRARTYVKNKEKKKTFLLPNETRKQNERKYPSDRRGKLSQFRLPSGSFFCLIPFLFFFFSFRTSPSFLLFLPILLSRHSALSDSSLFFSFLSRPSSPFLLRMFP